MHSNSDHYSVIRGCGLVCGGSAGADSIANAGIKCPKHVETEIGAARWRFSCGQKANQMKNRLLSTELSSLLFCVHIINSYSPKVTGDN